MTIEVTLTAPLPAAIECGAQSKLQWVNDALTGPGFKLLNSTIQSRRFGVLCMGRDGEITGNRFENNPGPSILLLNDDDYDNPAESRMGYMPRDILISGNSFVNCSRCVPDPYHAGTAPSLLAVIGSAVVGPSTPPFGSTPEPFRRVSYHGVQNITITGNSITNWYRGVAVLLGEVHGVAVTSNTISEPPRMPSGGARRGGAEAAVVVADSDTVVVAKNIFAGGWSSVSGAHGGAVQVASHSTRNINVTKNQVRPP